MRRGLFAALLVVAAVPAFAQFSESFNFLKAVRDRDGGKIAEIVSNPASTAINARDGTTGEGALHILVRGRDHGFLNYLLSRGARPDLQDNQGNSALNVAAQIGWVEGAELLIARGATVDLANRGGATPLIVSSAATPRSSACW
jgi:ankyrin repeat protein